MVVNQRVRKDLKENTPFDEDKGASHADLSKSLLGRLKYKVPKAGPAVPGVCEEYQSS